MVMDNNNDDDDDDVLHDGDSLFIRKMYAFSFPLRYTKVERLIILIKRKYNC